MPTAPDVPNVLRYRLTGTDSAGTPWGIRQFFQWQGTTPTTSILTGFANTCLTSWGAHIAPTTHTAYTLTLVGIEDLTSPTGASVLQPGSVPGTASGAVLPAGTAVLINHHIARRYRGGKPRTYLPPPTATQLQDVDHWTAAYVSGAQAAYASFITDIIAAPQQGCSIVAHVNVGYYHSFTPKVDPVTGRTKDVPKYKPGPILPDVITSSTCNPIVGSQRRRYNR